MVMRNATCGRTLNDLSMLLDWLVSRLLDFENLGRTQQKYSDFLIPLVESCLPETILIARERSRAKSDKKDGERSLQSLMGFYRKMFLERKWWCLLAPDFELTTRKEI
ncbi:uncharacterized protein CEXT_190431 [Caerostris extrusa]|uniref:Uncharacterized protein n=1 Tax=Caerostris extrusa TaxID=172846 RepID=A0AAV4V2U3_CAEEX|nr:uncharacterized protein CEXT_190431 [Caerostris extrusa]